MIKSLYDRDSMTWNPEGKLFQVEYAMNAVQQGSVCVGLRSENTVVIFPNLL